MTENLTALNKTLEKLKDAGRIEDVDAAFVQALRSIATALDFDPHNASLWKQYREALRELIKDDSSDAVPDDIDALYT